MKKRCFNENDLRIINGAITCMTTNRFNRGGCIPRIDQSKKDYVSEIIQLLHGHRQKLQILMNETNKKTKKFAEMSEQLQKIYKHLNELQYVYVSV